MPGDVATVAGAQALAQALMAREPVLDTNPKGPCFLTQALLPALRAGAKRPMAKVINIASIDGLSVNPQETYSHAASKSGLTHLTRRTALKLIDDGMAVNAICPGAFASHMNRAARDEAEAVSQRIPAKRIGAARGMAGAAIYLASRADNDVVGASLVVDGGVTHARG